MTFTIPIIEWKTASEADRKRILERCQADVDSARQVAREWIGKVRATGDEAVLSYIRTFDAPEFEASELRVSDEDIAAAYAAVRPDVLSALREQIRISKAFHEEQARRQNLTWEIETVPGVVTGVKRTPMDSVGLYVPAGKAPLPTVAQILTVAAKAAGVPRIVVCFAPIADNFEIIVAAKEAGADEIYRVGGIVAIAALAYGTDSIRPVNFIAGPGNPFVQAAKLEVFGQVGVDMFSGPSEALILADERANPTFLAADILARCEHGLDSAGVVVTNSMDIAKRTRAEVERQAPLLTRQQYIPTALERFSAIVVVDTLDQMVEFANEYSAEHLEVQVADADALLPRLRNAGSIFLGDFAPVAVGDYASGTNHCLPVGRAVKYSSPVGVETFEKRVEFQLLTKDGLDRLRGLVETISDVEGLDGHKRSVQVRFENPKF